MPFPRAALSALIALIPPAGDLAGQGAGPASRWEASAELSFTEQSGNSDLRVLTGGFGMSHLQRDLFQLDASATSRYGRSDGDLVTLSHSASIAADLRPETPWSPFFFSDAERDRFKRLDLRLSTGAGVKYTPLRAAERRGDASLSLALLHSFERLAEESVQPGGPAGAGAESIHRARWSLRARATRELRPGVTLRHTTFYQPVWDRMADYLLRSDSGVKVLMTERLALSVDYQLKRDARPPAGVEPDDRLLKTGLIIDF